MDDDSLRQLVNQLYGVAEGVIELAHHSPPLPPESYESSSQDTPPSGPVDDSAFDKVTGALTGDQEEEAVERAAIMEYDAGRPRDEAERYALGRVLKGPGIP